LLRGLEPNHGKFLKDGRSCLALGEPSSCWSLLMHFLDGQRLASEDIRGMLDQLSVMPRSPFLLSRLRCHSELSHGLEVWTRGTSSGS
jgi:hypothetical protein